MTDEEALKFAKEQIYIFGGTMKEFLQFVIDKLGKPQGEWKVKTLSTFPQYQPDEYECPFCKTIVNYKTNFCPNCGADMQKGGAE